MVCRHLWGNHISQSQAAAWWDTVVSVKAAKHGKATKVTKGMIAALWHERDDSRIIWQILP